MSMPIMPFDPEKGFNASFALLLFSIVEMGLSAAMVDQAESSYRNAAIWTLIVSLFSIVISGYLIWVSEDTKVVQTRYFISAVLLAATLWIAAFCALVAAHASPGGGGAPVHTLDKRGLGSSLKGNGVGFGSNSMTKAGTAVTCDIFAGLCMCCCGYLLLWAEGWYQWNKEDKVASKSLIEGVGAESV